MTHTSLGALCDFTAVQVNPADNPSLPYLGLEHVPPGRFEALVSGRAQDVSSSKYLFKHGDVLYGKLRPYLDKAVIAHSDGLCTTELLVLRPKDGVDARFLASVVHSDQFIDYAMAGVTGAQHPRTSWPHLREFSLPAVDPTTQTRIGTIAEIVQRALTNSEATLDSAAALKRAAMRELFTRGLRGMETQESEVGPIPEAWKCEPLGEVADIVYGAQAAVAAALDPKIGLLILTNVNIGTDGTLDLTKRRYYAVPEHQRDRLILKRGDVLFNWRSGSSSHVGKTAYFDLDEECTFSSFILRFRPHRSVSAKYLYHYLSELRARDFFSNRRNVSSINSVFNASLSATIPVWYPDADSQQEIVEVLDAIDQKIDQHKRKRAVLEELFKALLHKLMIGEVRVTDLDLSALVGEDQPFAVTR